MGTRRIGVAHTVYKSHFAFIIKGFEGCHARIEADFVIELDHLVLGDIDVGAIVPVERIGVGDDRVEIVITTTQLQDDQNWIFSHYIASLSIVLGYAFTS